MSKRLLIITYYWPPSAGGGVQRWLKFAKYLPDHNWTPVIYTPSNPSYSLQDTSLLADIAPDLEVIKTPIWEPYDLASIFKRKGQSTSLNTGQTNKTTRSSRILSWIRGNYFIPDPRRYWVKPSIKYLEKYLRDNPVDAIVTTGPPHSMHLIGLGLKQSLGIKWLVDIRDPWSTFDLLDEYNISPRNLKKYQAMETAVLQACDRVIATSPSMSKQLRTFDTDKFQAITNGYDKKDFENYQDMNSEKELVLYHAGLISALRNPTNFWTALESLITEDRLGDKTMRLHLVGVIESAVQSSIDAQPALSQHYLREPYKKHDLVIEDYQKAHILLLFVNNTANAKVNIPGKTFEYLATGKPILCFSDPDTDVAKILSKMEHCLVVDYNLNSETLAQKLSVFFGTHKSFTSQDVAQFSRGHLTSVLVEVLNKL